MRAAADRTGIAGFEQNKNRPPPRAADRLSRRILTVDESGSPSADGPDLGPSWFWPHARPGVAAQVGRPALLALRQVHHHALERDVEVSRDEQHAAGISGQRMEIELHDERLSPASFDSCMSAMASACGYSAR
jgi:hypothetical protein